MWRSTIYLWYLVQWDMGKFQEGVKPRCGCSFGNFAPHQPMLFLDKKLVMRWPERNYYRFHVLFCKFYFFKWIHSWSSVSTFCDIFGPGSIFILAKSFSLKIMFVLISHLFLILFLINYTHAILSIIETHTLKCRPHTFHRHFSSASSLNWAQPPTRYLLWCSGNWK